MRTFKLGTTLTKEGKFALQDHNLVLVESIETYVTGSIATTKNHIDIPERALAILNVTVEWNTKEKAKFYEVKQNYLLKEEYPNLLAIPTVHKIQDQKLSVIPYVLINLSYAKIQLPKGEILGHLQPIQCKIQTENKDS